MIKITLVLVTQTAEHKIQDDDIKLYIDRLNEIAAYHDDIEKIRDENEEIETQVTLSYFFYSDTKAIDFAQESIADVPDAILSTIKRVSFEKE